MAYRMSGSVPEFSPGPNRQISINSFVSIYFVYPWFFHVNRETACCDYGVAGQAVDERIALAPSGKAVTIQTNMDKQKIKLILKFSVVLAVCITEGAHYFSMERGSPLNGGD